MTDRLTAKEAAAYLKKPTVAAFDKWATRRGVQPHERCGRIRFFSKAFLDRVLRVDAQKVMRHG